MKKKIIIGIIAVLALVCLLSSIYTVEESVRLYRPLL